MNKLNLFLLIFLFSIFSVGWLSIFTDPNLLNLYAGIPFNGNWYVVLLNYFLFSCYSFYLFKKVDKYINGYGIYVVLRVQSKMKIIKQLLFKTLVFVFMSELIKLLVYSFFILLFYDEFYISNYFIFVNMFIINILFLFLILSIQISLELFFDSKIALFFIQISYLILIVLGNIVWWAFKGSYLNLLILTNIIMYKRLGAFYNLNWLNIYVIYLLFLILLLLLVFIIKKFINKKNWL